MNMTRRDSLRFSATERSTVITASVTIRDFNRNSNYTPLLLFLSRLVKWNWNDITLHALTYQLEIQIRIECHSRKREEEFDTRKTTAKSALRLNGSWPWSACYDSPDPHSRRCAGNARRRMREDKRWGRSWSGSRSYTPDVYFPFHPEPQQPTWSAWQWHLKQILFLIVFCY